MSQEDPAREDEDVASCRVRAVRRWTDPKSRKKTPEVEEIPTVSNVQESGASGNVRGSSLLTSHAYWRCDLGTQVAGYPCEVTDISNRGAQVMAREQLETGTVVRLQIVAPEGAPLRVGAVVRRIDADGVAFSFARSIYRRSIHVA
jgi:hypothetical protein